MNKLSSNISLRSNNIEGLVNLLQKYESEDLNIQLNLNDSSITSYVCFENFNFLILPSEDGEKLCLECEEQNKVFSINLDRVDYWEDCAIIDTLHLIIHINNDEVCLWVD